MSEEFGTSLAKVYVRDALTRLYTRFLSTRYELITPELEPEIANGLMHRELLQCWGTGHDMYGQLLQDQQHYKKKPSDLIHYFASFTDLCFFDRFPAYIPHSWHGKRVYGWRSCLNVGCPWQKVVPYLDCTGISVDLTQPLSIQFRSLCEHFGEGDYSAVRTGFLC